MKRCNKCGQELADTAKFCPFCGGPQEETRSATKDIAPEIKRFNRIANAAVPFSWLDSKQKRILAVLFGLVGLLTLLLILSLVVGFGGYGKPFYPKEKGFDTPRQAIEYFAQSVAADNFDAALSACAVSKPAALYDLQAQIDWTGSYVPGMKFAPSGKMMTEGNRAQRLGEFAGEIKLFCISLTMDEGMQRRILSGISVETGEEQDIFSQYLGRLSEKPWKSLELVEVYRAYPDDWAEQMEPRLEKKREIYKADALEEFIALYRCDGQYYKHSYSMVCYAGKWSILDFYSIYAKGPSDGSAEIVPGWQSFQEEAERQQLPIAR